VPVEGLTALVKRVPKAILKIVSGCMDETQVGMGEKKRESEGKGNFF
jgi:hypothetical protein